MRGEGGREPSPSRETMWWGGGVAGEGGRQMMGRRIKKASLGMRSGPCSGGRRENAKKGAKEKRQKEG